MGGRGLAEFVSEWMLLPGGKDVPVLGMEDEGAAVDNDGGCGSGCLLWAGVDREPPLGSDCNRIPNLSRCF